MGHSKPNCQQYPPLTSTSQCLPGRQTLPALAAHPAIGPQPISSASQHKDSGDDLWNFYRGGYPIGANLYPVRGNRGGELLIQILEKIALWPILFQCVGRHKVTVFTVAEFPHFQLPMMLFITQNIQSAALNCKPDDIPICSLLPLRAHSRQGQILCFLCLMAFGAAWQHPP